ncbi:DUF4825 domain-containing protein [Alteribacter aurantiacus]|uniref:DUF4825 domain-containing protein n=1 Tax=Alteribacter aurantiacus TaxID=254410 RepID=UPI00041B4609|nr:DUF4825 domain-containing protein [Alteribacter aurantiacus]
MNKLVVVLSCFIIIIGVSGCNSIEQNEPEDLFQFKDSYVGDAGVVGSITRELPNPNGEQVHGLELETTNKPYGVILNYIESEKSEGIATDYNELALYNASFILALVHNADWVSFKFLDQELTITREDTQSFFEKDITQFNSEQELSSFIQETLENKTFQILD